MQVQAKVESQRQLAEDTFCLRVTAPEIARVIQPGQFLMIRPEGGFDPILGRPFALYDVTPGQDAFEFVYHVVGKMTHLMSEWTGGEEVEVWGPLGNGFPTPAGKHLLCVGGGIGYTPFPAVIRAALGLKQFGESPWKTNTERVTFCYAAQTASKLADLEGVESLENVSVQLATDDGSRGHHGLVTDLVARALEESGDDRPDEVFCCGPERMMQAVAKLCEQHQVNCWLSLETPMACGFGACFSCVTKVKTPDGWDYRRTCVEGPIFSSADLELSEA
ncbi:MAG: dihydroorotate dehydrogenase electron transfer subunit [Planctomycetaceae bacterium]